VREKRGEAKISPYGGKAKNGKKEKVKALWEKGINKEKKILNSKKFKKKSPSGGE